MRHACLAVRGATIALDSRRPLREALAVPGGRPRRWLGIAIAVTATLAAAAQAGGDWWTVDPEAVAERVRDAGIAGPAVLLALLVLQCVVAPLPSEPLMIAAGYVYGPLVGFALGLVGVTAGAAACFGLSRRYGRRVAERVLSARKLAALDAHLAGRSAGGILFAVFLFRLLAFGSFDVLSYACGLMLIPFGWFVAVSAVGVVPKVFAFTYLGASATDGQPLWLSAMIVAGTFGILLAAPLWLRRGARSISA